MENCEERLVRRLGAAGCPLLEDSEDRICSSRGEVVLEQVGGVTENSVFTLDCGHGAGYILHTVVTNRLDRSLGIRAWSLEPPWEAQQSWWLAEPENSGQRGALYRFSGTSALEFPTEMVINHRVDSRGRLRRGDILEGVLLRVSLTDIPNRFQHGAQVEMTLSMIDQMGHKFSLSVSLWVDRSATLNRRPTRRSRRSLIDELGPELSPQCEGLDARIVPIKGNASSQGKFQPRQRPASP